MVVLGVLIGGVPDNESGFHTQGCADTNWPVLRRGVYVAKNIYIYIWHFVCIMVQYLVKRIRYLRWDLYFRRVCTYQRVGGYLQYKSPKMSHVLVYSI